MSCSTANVEAITNWKQKTSSYIIHQINSPQFVRISLRFSLAICNKLCRFYGIEIRVWFLRASLKSTGMAVSEESHFSTTGLWVPSPILTHWWRLFSCRHRPTKALRVEKTWLRRECHSSLVTFHLVVISVVFFVCLRIVNFSKCVIVLRYDLVHFLPSTYIAV